MLTIEEVLKMYEEEGKEFEINDGITKEKDN